MSMKSVARRTSVNLGSPELKRSRSAERSMRQAGEGIQLQMEPPSLLHQGDPVSDEQLLYANRERLSSESSISKQVRSHRRAVSDPFDTAEMEGITDGIADGPTDEQGLAEEAENALPTLHRWPYAENNNKNCWSEPPIDNFQVRGPRYMTDKKKITATSYLLRARGCDLFLSDKPNTCDMAK